MARSADGCVPPAQVMGKNVSIYKSQASALEKFAAKDVKARLSATHIVTIRLASDSYSLRRLLWLLTLRTRTR